MPEIVFARPRIAGVDFAPVIENKAGIATAVWKEQPLTLRDDEVSMTSEGATEDPVYSHENDYAEENEITAGDISVVGSFIRAKLAELSDLLGGEMNGTSMFMKSAQAKVLTQAIRFRLKKGGSIIIFKAEGFVNTSASLGATDGRMKFPFKFKCLGQKDFPFVYALELADGSVQIFGAPASAPITEEDKTPKK